MIRRQGFAIVAIALMIPCASITHAQGWGSITGQFVWPDKEPLPKPKPIVAPPGAGCPAGLVDNRELVDAESRGLKNVMVWFDTVKLDGKVGPVHPKLAKPAVQTVKLNQPACLFVERITLMRTDQVLEIGNAAGVAHNTRIMFRVNSAVNILLAPGGTKSFKNLRSEPRPVGVACDLHGWMAGQVGVFDHPYFAVSDKQGNFAIDNIPAGELILFMLHEKNGWQHAGNLKQGQKITIKAGQVADLGKIPVRILKD
jgi:hypothetical protein